MAGGLQPAAGEQQGRRYWRWSKADFFPEPSFQSWRAYGGALAATVPRLRDRLAARSSDAIEAGTLLAESENPLRRCLSWVDLAFLGFGSVVGSGVFVLTGQEARFDAGPAIPLAYAAAGFSALLSSFCYAELATEIPSAGGSFSYLRVELGDLAAFLAAGNILLEAVVGAAGLGRSWTSYLAALIGRDSDSLRIHVPALAEGFNLLDPIAVVVLISTSALAMSGARLTSTINSLASVIGIVIIAFVMGFGFSHFDSSNLEPSFFPFGAAGVFRAAAVVYWSYTGFDMVATMAEETKNPGRDVPLGLLSSMSAITLVYCAMSLALVGMQKYSDIDPNAAYSVAFAATGLKWARYVVALGALKGMTSGLLVGALGQARYTDGACLSPGRATIRAASRMDGIQRPCLPRTPSPNFLPKKKETLKYRQFRTRPALLSSEPEVGGGGGELHGRRLGAEEQRRARRGSRGAVVLDQTDAPQL